MNPHIRKGNEALQQKDYKTARSEFMQALASGDEMAKRIARNRISDLPEEPFCLSPVTLSACCLAEAVFVLSRTGGFVTKNCTKCKRTGYAREEDFPSLECCGEGVTVRLIDKDYYYKCQNCLSKVRVADIVPKWSELFEYNGLVAPGDSNWTGRCCGK